MFSNQGDCRDAAVINRKSPAQGELAGGKKVAIAVGTLMHLLSWASVNTWKTDRGGIPRIGGARVILPGDITQTMALS